jgi:hypothetical protein
VDSAHEDKAKKKSADPLSILPPPYRDQEEKAEQDSDIFFLLLETLGLEKHHSRLCAAGVTGDNITDVILSRKQLEAMGFTRAEAILMWIEISRRVSSSVRTSSSARTAVADQHAAFQPTLSSPNAEYEYERCLTRLLSK